MRIRAIYLGAIFGCMVLAASAAEPVSGELPGLTVCRGELLLKGKPYRGIGANYFSLFYRVIKDPADDSYQDGLKRLSEAGIPFVRFMACGFWPIDWDQYLNDKEAYFRRLDRVIAAAEEADIGLVPSLFWHMPTVSDVVGEPIDQLGNPQSKTIAFMRQYTEEVVLRYRDSPAIWGWEFGNEYNLVVDLPNAAEHRPKVVPELKTALARTARDELSCQGMLRAFAAFAETVRKHDKHRVIITGNSIPGPSAFHNSTERSWEKDTREQFSGILLRDNPDPFDVISVHVYGSSGQANTKSIAELVATLQDISASAGKPLFVGEFGASATLGKDKERALFLEILRAIEASKVPLSAFWVFDYPGQNKDWNVTFDNERSYMLRLVAAANRRMKADANGVSERQRSSTATARRGRRLDGQVRPGHRPSIAALPTASTPPPADWHTL
jgi:hypothetical protein